MAKELHEARTKDLGCDQFTNYIAELMVIERECQHTIAHLHEWVKPESVDTPFLAGPGRSSVVKEPLGVIAILGSWNFPFLTVLCPMISAIAAGNACLVKPSEISPFSSTKLKQLIARNLDRESI